ncbi:MAG TPA: pilus assembly protein N-terminal domain-containing protein [Pyrinomonadaceae bacterium]|nr:pilus assembly protein N-terminal domain-containing protein [Pyrinomonadaceae bacterium]
MQNRSLVARIAVLFGALAASTALGLAPAHAQQKHSSVSAVFSSEEKEPVQINVLVGQSRVINFDRAIGRFSVSNPEVAEAVLVAPDQVLVNGKAFGQVNFIAWEKSGGQFVVFDVYVRSNLSLIDSQIRALFPKESINVSQANGSVVLSGSVSNMKVAQQAEAVVQAAGFKTVNMLETPVKAAAQIQLMVRVAEVSKSKMREIGTSLGFVDHGTVGYMNSGLGPSSLKSVGMSDGPSGSIVSSETVLTPALNLLLGNNMTGLTGMLRALKSVGAIRSLAEPNLIAMDGQQASFLAGGEFPVPVVQATSDKTSVTIVWKEYGVRLNFKPTIIDEDHIRLELEPEVSTIDFANGVKFEGFLIPALRTRRAKTGVELRDGQSFALAGLLDNAEIQSFSKVPGLGDIPILGNLFKSKSFTKSETELMFIVTAQMVKPVSPDDIPQQRGLDGLKQGKGPLGLEPKGEGINGEHGFSTAPASTSSVAPTTQAPATVAPTAVAPANVAPSSAAPATSTPATSTPASDAPVKDAPAATQDAPKVGASKPATPVTASLNPTPDN